MKKWMIFKCSACGHKERVPLPPLLRDATHMCSNCSTDSKLRPRILRAALLGLVGPAVAWAAYQLAYPELPPYLALFLATAIVVLPAIFARSRLIEWATAWKIEAPK